MEVCVCLCKTVGTYVAVTSLNVCSDTELYTYKVRRESIKYQ